MDQDKDRLSIDAARLYYESDMSQQKIANELYNGPLVKTTF